MTSRRIAAVIALSCGLIASSESASGAGCDSSKVTSENAKAMADFNKNLIANPGDVCSSWNTFECAMTNAFKTCDYKIKSSAAGKVTVFRKMAEAINGAVKSCTANCAEGSPSPAAPSPVLQSFDTLIELADPTTFTVDKFVKAIQTATGVKELPTAILEMFEIIVQYTVPHGTTAAKLKAAVAKANSVAENQVVVAAAGARRRLADAPINMDVTITIDGKTDPAAAATKAKAVKTSATSTASLKTELGGDVAVKIAPKAKAKVTTKVKAALSETAALKSNMGSSSVNSAIGGTVTVSEPAAPATSHAASSFSAALATVLVFFRATM